MLRWFIKKINGKNEGFTLIEMIVVVAIIAILVGIAVPQAVKQINRAKISADLANARNIAMAIQQYVADGGDASKLSTNWKSIEEDTFIVPYLSGGVPKPKYSSDYKGFCYKYQNETVHVGVYKDSSSLTDDKVDEIYPNPEQPYNQ
ncbi:conserved hypothetical protein [Caldicellulosiruptor hydrothermalis 108]|uniref:Uncharacterized protein n=1 Tax=Caldicellulosiruptor hydrothermalis (strain DSM 18901 / VKM B-2411 / 108) TaxID=632292 RepID=E4Q7B5_CALH1|nr:type II secretion system protein [Caldicellulosiruptor hydrothermalis]ADQ06628.1 conserved hypothetical protein [Caldicellulosiruptor hydrothermalis 108]